MKQCDLYKKSLTESPATLSTPRRSPIEAMPELVQSDLWLSSCHSLILRKYNIQYNSTQLEVVPRVECNLSAECSLNLFSNNNCSLLFLWPPQTHFTLDEILSVTQTHKGERERNCVWEVFGLGNSSWVEDKGFYSSALPFLYLWQKGKNRQAWQRGLEVTWALWSTGFSTSPHSRPATVQF